MTINEAIIQIEAIKKFELGKRTIDGEYVEALDMAIEALKTVQEHEETFEWCVECKEYDQEQHCCHRWTKQIRKTIAEFEEDNGIVRCNECIFYMAMGENRAWGKCRIHDRTAQDIDYCSWGERK